MGKFRIEITLEAQNDLKKHYKSGNKATIKRLEKILIELTETPFTGIGNPEALKHQFSGLWSRQLNQKDRIVYEVDNNIVTVYILSALGHYYDK